MRTLCALLSALALSAGIHAQTPPSPAAANPTDLPERIRLLEENLRYANQTLAKSIDDLLWHQRLDDVAAIDKVRYTSRPPHYVKNPTGQGATNPVIIPAYTFTPRKFASARKLPLLVLVHDGIHGDLSTLYVHVIRELLDQGYIIIAPEYRGSAGYGGTFYKQIDYGGFENDDVLAGKQWAVENLAQVDTQRVGIMGWSHGGMITLMNIFDHPSDYKVAYAGVPVSDIISRMGYKTQSYRNEFAAETHIGKEAADNVAEYRRRSPVWNAQKLKTPLLVHTNTNDEDVNSLEVESLINALKAHDKKFEYKIYQDAPGGHSFNRLDTKQARESRDEIYRFLARHLSPPNAVK